jgi:hypothetical protein
VGCFEAFSAEKYLFHISLFHFSTSTNDTCDFHAVMGTSSEKLPRIPIQNLHRIRTLTGNNPSSEKGDGRAADKIHHQEFEIKIDGKSHDVLCDLKNERVRPGTKRRRKRLFLGTGVSTWRRKWSV